MKRFIMFFFYMKCGWKWTKADKVLTIIDEFDVNSNLFILLLKTYLIAACQNNIWHTLILDDGIYTLNSLPSYHKIKTNSQSCPPLCEHWMRQQSKAYSCIQ